jgi:hypothetical protein
MTGNSFYNTFIEDDFTDSLGLLIEGVENQRYSLESYGLIVGCDSVRFFLVDMNEEIIYGGADFIHQNQVDQLLRK